MNWIIQAYADAYKVVLGDTETFKSAPNGARHPGSREKSHRQTNRK